MSVSMRKTARNPTASQIVKGEPRSAVPMTAAVTGSAKP